MSILRRLRGQQPKSPLRGALEGVCNGIAFGWAVNRQQPERPVRLQILVDGKPVATIDTPIKRNHIEAASACGYRCGFAFDLRLHVPEFAGQQLTLRDAESAKPFGLPVVLQRGGGAGVLDAVHGLHVCGWAVPMDPGVRAAEVEILLDGETAGVALADQARPDVRLAGAPLAKTGFRFPVPPRWCDGRPHTVTARIRGSQQPLLSVEPLIFKATLKAHIDVLSRQRASGWIVNLDAPQVPVQFDVWVNGQLAKRSVGTAHRRIDVEQAVLKREHPDAKLGFDVALTAGINWRTEGSNQVMLCFPGTDVPIRHEVTAAVDPVVLVQRLEALSASLLDDTLERETEDGDVHMRRALRLHLAPLICQAVAGLRTGGSLRQPYMVRGLSDEDEKRGVVDVIVPVYKGYQETIDCIRSVLDAADDTQMELIVINDQSPDPRLSEELRRMAKEDGFTLIENSKNLGFVATVNVGMRLHSDRDVVLLNSDTVVPRGWLAGIRRAAYSHRNIATVTPLSNRATIFSLPRTCQDNDMVLGMGVEDMHRLCSERNDGVVVDVPTAMGFCMYIRRHALDEVGLFDEERWAKGYAEENDFSLRAAARGWRNVAACDVFVQHHGSVSFEGEKAPRVQENLAKLNAIYPDYPQRVQRFIETDPIAMPRGRVNMALLKKLSPSYVLFITHGLGGGTETAIRDLCQRHAKDGRHVLILRSTPAGRLELAPATTAHERALTTEYPHGTPSAALAEQLRELNIEYVHIHHSLGFKPEIWDLPAFLGVPFDVTVHDYYLVCPRITMIDESGQYCGQPSIASCERCISTNPLQNDVQERLAEVGGTVEAWRAFHGEGLAKARRVMAPSKDTVVRVQKYLPAQPIEAAPHAEAPYHSALRRITSDGAPHTIAVIGAIGPHKGANMLLAFAKYAKRENLPLRFLVVGYTSCDEAFEGLDNVEITGAYKPADLPALLEESGACVALFLSVWPETYSYTLSEAWRAGLTPVALDIGAPAERIRERGHGHLVPFPCTLHSLSATLMKAVIETTGESTLENFVQTQAAMVA